MGRCCVPYCRGNYDNGPKVRLFSLPRDAARRIVWQRAISRSDVDITTLRDPKVCELHFKPECLRTTSRYTSSDGITLEAPMGLTRLTEDAVPTIFPNSPAAYGSDFAPLHHALPRKRRRLEASHLQEAPPLSLSTHTGEQPKNKPSSYDGLFLWLPDIQAGKKELACCHSHGVLMKNVGTEVSWPSIKKVDAGVGTPVCNRMTKSTQALLPTFKVHRWTETSDLGDYGDSDTDTQEFLVVPVPVELVGANHQEESSPTAAAGSTRIAYSCSYCLQEFWEIQDLTNHVGMCPWLQPHKCPLCSNVCSNWTSMQDHIATHVEKLGTKCPLCEHAVVVGNSDVLRHIMRHLTFKPFLCNVCKSSFLNGYDIAAHVCRRAGQQGRWAFPLRTTPQVQRQMCHNSS